MKDQVSETVFESNSDGTGVYQCAIVGIEPNTNYYVRAFAENN